MNEVKLALMIATMILVSLVIVNIVVFDVMTITVLHAFSSASQTSSQPAPARNCHIDQHGATVCQ